MNTDERQLIRHTLIVTGSKRTGFTPANADGSYTETWKHPDGTEVTLAWAPHR